MEIHVNSNTSVKHKIFWKGSPYDLDANALPVVYVYDITEDPTIIPPIDPSTLIMTLTAEKVETDVGVYEVYIPYYLTSRPKRLKLTWTYIVESTNISKSHDVFVITPYVDIIQAMDILGIGSDPSDPNFKTFNELQQAERYARKVIESYTGQNFYLYHDTHVVYGDDSDSLRLPFKINALHELYQNDILLVDNINNVNNLGFDVDISPSSFGIKINRTSLLDNTVYIANGLVPPSINDMSFGVFRKGVPYMVNGEYGWNEVPDDIELAGVELMKDFFSKDKIWRNKYVHSVQSHDWHFEYNAEAYRGTGNVYVDQLLLPYVLTQLVVI